MKWSNFFTTISLGSLGKPNISYRRWWSWSYRWRLWYDPDDPFSIVEGRGSRKRFHKSQSKQDVGDTTYETKWPALRSTVHPGIRPTIQSVVLPSSDKNVNSNRPSTTNTTQIRRNGQSAVHKSVNKTLLVGCKSPQSNGHQQLRAAKSWTNFVEKSILCLDNVSLVISIEELGRFVSSLKVKVVSCFEVKNRLSAWQRRTDDACSGDHNTSSLCIAKADSSKLLQSNAWPSYCSQMLGQATAIKCLAKLLQSNAWPNNCSQMLGQATPVKCLAKLLQSNAWPSYYSKMLGQATPVKCLVKLLQSNAWPSYCSQMFGQATTVKCLVKLLQSNAWSSYCSQMLGQATAVKCLAELLQSNAWPSDIIIAPWFRARPKYRASSIDLVGLQMKSSDVYPTLWPTTSISECG